MATQSQAALTDPVGEEEDLKPKKTRTRRTGTAKTQKNTPKKKTAKPARKSQTSKPDELPVMKLRAIDIVGDDKPVSGAKRKPETRDGDTPQVIHLPPPLNEAARQAGQPAPGKPAPEKAEADTGPAPAATAETAAPEQQPSGPAAADTPGQARHHAVSDPELLELLEKLSVTINTANSVLDAAASMPGQEDKPDPARADAPQPEQQMPPQAPPFPEPRGGEPTPLSAGSLPGADAPPPPPRKSSFGLGLFVNTALTGFVFAAGVAWILHTNPWLLEGRKTAQVEPAFPAGETAGAKDQSKLKPDGIMAARAAVAPAPEPVSFTPPDEEPVPMEAVQPAEAQAAAPQEPAGGPAGEPIALNIPVPTGARNGETSIMVQGVPDGATLSAGKDLGSGNWLLNDRDVEGLALETGETFAPGEHELEVIMVKSDGTVPETRKVAVTVEPASPAGPEDTRQAGVGTGGQTAYARTGVPVTVPPQAEAAPPVEKAEAPAEKPMPSFSQHEVDTVLTRADSLLAKGDVSGARLLLEFAAQRGSKTAMLTLASTYDPEHLASLGVRGVQPDMDKAAHWYERAAKADAADR